MSFLKTPLMGKKRDLLPQFPTQNSETWNKNLPIFYCNLPSISPPTYNTWPAMTTCTPCHREAAHRPGGAKVYGFAAVKVRNPANAKKMPRLKWQMESRWPVGLGYGPGGGEKDSGVHHTHLVTWENQQVLSLVMVRVSPIFLGLFQVIMANPGF